MMELNMQMTTTELKFVGKSAMAFQPPVVISMVAASTVSLYMSTKMNINLKHFMRVLTSVPNHSSVVSLSFKFVIILVLKHDSNLSIGVPNCASDITFTNWG